MRVSFNWLKEYVDIDVDPHELAEKLTLAGIAVERVIELGRGVERVVTGRIEELGPHPNADRLQVALVNVGTEKLQVVTAATNVRPGDVVPVALEGAKLASGLSIKRARLRGVESRGMMCSGQELGLDPKTMPPEEAHGIMILPPGTPVGRDAKEVLGLNDFILELDLTPNRGDCLCVYGVAREAAALLDRPLKPVTPAYPELPETIWGQVRVDIEDTDLCGRFVGRLVKNVKVGRSPLWMQQRLRSAGMRPINNIVDVTNYVMLELGQPMHAFDYDLLLDGHIVVRRARPGEKIVTLDGTERELLPGMLLITDPSGPVAVAGVMGGLNTEVTDKTVSVLLEAAYFNPVSIRKTSRALGLRSEASLRFEKGIDIGGCDRASARAAQLIAEIGAGDVVAQKVDNYPVPAAEKKIWLRPARVSQLLGVDIPQSQAAQILQKLHFGVCEAEDGLLVSVPTHRPDVGIEVDLVEEIARLYGYGRIPGTLPYGPTTCGIKTKEQSQAALVRRVLSSTGLFEVVTYSFTSPRIFDKFGLPQDSPLRSALKILNPLSEEHSIMRTLLLPGLLEVLARNYHRSRVKDGAIFEMGRVFYPKGEGVLPEERPKLAAAAMGRTPGGWSGAGREMDFFYLKGVLENLLRALKCGPAVFAAAPGEAGFHPGRSAYVEVEGVRVGVIGELHPDTAERFELPEKVAAWEIDLSRLLEVSGRPTVYTPIPRFPAAERDIAVVLGEEVPAAEVEKAIWEAGGELLRGVHLFDVYRGEQIPAGCKSLAFSLVFYAPDRTLTDEEAAAGVEAVEKELARRFGARLRS